MALRASRAVASHLAITVLGSVDGTLQRLSLAFLVGAVVAATGILWHFYAKLMDRTAEPPLLTPHESGCVSHDLPLPCLLLVASRCRLLKWYTRCFTALKTSPTACSTSAPNVSLPGDGTVGCLHHACDVRCSILCTNSLSFIRHVVSLRFRPFLALVTAIEGRTPLLPATAFSLPQDRPLSRRRQKEEIGAQKALSFPVGLKSRQSRQSTPTSVTTIEDCTFLLLSSPESP
ncbi:hypothetical protein B0T26DRAFT_23133 [Lasiosphaeria miniovina]|uniref:Uncharacterized protein n=1 Tax=Lasiosphaeria miniovina TaxID=1954250 RepID=A0AA40BFV9_9PEZI|nr:uncharacterized protein B0T26DRAFT_23133 [Lasiosphaeria miniovina]KAK0733480.1 hypothetical protein B0T26DRAFT_23133 [Lasiosphaeria miniovina]